VEEDHDKEHLNKLHIFKSTRPERLHPEVLKSKDFFTQSCSGTDNSM